MLEGVFNKMFGLTDEKIIKQMRKKSSKNKCCRRYIYKVIK